MRFSLHGAAMANNLIVLVKSSRLSHHDLYDKAVKNGHSKLGLLHDKNQIPHRYDSNLPESHTYYGVKVRGEKRKELQNFLK